MTSAGLKQVASINVGDSGMQRERERERETALIYMIINVLQTGSGQTFLTQS